MGWKEHTHINLGKGQKARHFKSIPYKKKQQTIKSHVIDFPPGFYKFMNPLLLVAGLYLILCIIARYLKPSPTYTYNYNYN